MEYITHLLLFLIAIPGIFSDAFPRGTREELNEVFQCREFCDNFNRECDEVSLQCRCRRGYVNRDGECLPYAEDEELDVKQKGPRISTDDDALDLMAAQRDAPEDGTDLAAADESNGVNSERVEAQGEGAHIPDNAQIDRIHHADGHSQDHKVQELYKAAEEPITPDGPHGDVAETKAILKEEGNMADVYFLAVIAGCSIAGLIGLVVAGVCWYRLQKNVKAASETEYPAYGVTGPVPEKVASPGDRKLAQSAQMYHYQHQKQQMIAMEKANGDTAKDGSDADSEEENEEGDYTVYECPGLAPTGEMEVKNPLFSEETPVTPSENQSPPK